MRKTLEIIALCLVLLSWAVTANAVLGRNPLPARIPTHFNATGQPDGWGTPAMLWLIPRMGTVIYLLMTPGGALSVIVPLSHAHYAGGAAATGGDCAEHDSPGSRLRCSACLPGFSTGRSGSYAGGREGSLRCFVPLLLVAVFGTIGVAHCGDAPRRPRAVVQPDF